jgi:hypothetical protein
VPPSGYCSVVRGFEPNKLIVTAALVGLMTFRQEQERALCTPGVLFSRVSAQMVKGLPVTPLFGLLLTLPTLGLGPGQAVDVLLDGANACRCSFNATANHLPALATRFPNFLSCEPQLLFPMRECLGQRVRAILLPYFAGWPDTLQLNYANPATQEAMTRT